MHVAESEAAVVLVLRSQQLRGKGREVPVAVDRNDAARPGFLGNLDRSPVMIGDVRHRAFELADLQRFAAAGGEIEEAA